MNRVVDPCLLRLAAIDLDGTLLAPDLSISEGNRRAIEKLQAENIEVVIASGRHYSSILPFAAQLPGVRWIVSAQGAEVSNASRSLVLRRDFLSRSSVERVIDLGNRLGLAAMFYTPDGILTNVTSPRELEFYAGLAGVSPARLDSESLIRAHVHKVVWIGSPPKVESLALDPRVVELELQCVQTHARLLEVIPVGVTKASGLTVLAKHLGMTAEETVVFGDADNDIPMFEWAGESVAMPHGWPAAIKSARWVGPDGSPAEALARAVDFVVSRI